MIEDIDQMTSEMAALAAAVGGGKAYTSREAQLIDAERIGKLASEIRVLREAHRIIMLRRAGELRRGRKVEVKS